MILALDLMSHQKSVKIGNYSIEEQFLGSKRSYTRDFLGMRRRESSGGPSAIVTLAKFVADP
jgi:hypothetical protein